MENAFEKLAREIKFDITPSFKKVVVKNAKLLENNVFNIDFENNEVIPFHEMEYFLKALRDNFSFKARFSFDIVSVIYVEAEVKKYLD